MKKIRYWQVPILHTRGDRQLHAVSRLSKSAMDLHAKYSHVTWSYMLTTSYVDLHCKCNPTTRRCTTLPPEQKKLKPYGFNFDFMYYMGFLNTCN